MSNKYLVTPSYQQFGRAAPMSDRFRVVSSNVKKYRERAGLSQAELATKIGVKSQNTIAAIEGGKTQQSKYLFKISRALNVSMADLDPDYEGEEMVRVSGAQLVGERDFEVFGSVEAGDGAIVVSNEHIEMIRRPAPLLNVRGGYGVLVQGTSMVPVARPGHIALVNPHLVPRAEDVCLFISDQDGTFRATLKEYCGQTGDLWKVKRYQPKERTYTLAKADWPRCEVVVGFYTRR